MTYRTLSYPEDWPLREGDQWLCGETWVNVPEGSLNFHAPFLKYRRPIPDALAGCDPGDEQPEVQP